MEVGSSTLMQLFANTVALNMDYWYDGDIWLKQRNKDKEFLISVVGACDVSVAVLSRPYSPPAKKCVVSHDNS